jgi:uncharacterized cupredoxin-like copper-binding protein
VSTRLLPPVALAALLIAACGEEGRELATSVTVAASEHAFEPDELRVPAGEEVTVDVTAEDAAHDFVIEGGGEVGMVADADLGELDEEHEDNVGREDLHVVHVPASQTVSGAFEITEPGTYVVYCAVPGHRDAGMTATLEVVDDG